MYTAVFFDLQHLFYNNSVYKRNKGLIYKVYQKLRTPEFLASLGNKVKAAVEYGMSAKYIFDMGNGTHQGLSTYGPMVYNGLKASGPTAWTVASLLL